MDIQFLPFNYLIVYSLNPEGGNLVCPRMDFSDTVLLSHILFSCVGAGGWGVGVEILQLQIRSSHFKPEKEKYC